MGKCPKKEKRDIVKDVWITGNDLVLDNGTVEEIDTESSKLSSGETTDLYNNIITSLQDCEIGIDFKQIFMIGSGKVNISHVDYNGNHYEPKQFYVLQFEALNEQGQWVNDGNLYVSTNTVGSNENARFVVVGQIPITNLTHGAHLDNKRVKSLD